MSTPETKPLRLTATGTVDGPLDDVHVESFTRIASPLELRGQLPATEEHWAVVQRGRDDIAHALTGEDHRMVVIVGPCSIHDPELAVEYGQRLKTLTDEVSDELIVVMRTYFEKPRTAVGWKGLIYDPSLDGTSDAPRGLTVSRQVLLDITSLGLPCAVEVLDTITPQYQADLVSWAAIGARTVESQVHRQLSSGLSMPIGFKNGTDGTLDGAVNAVQSAIAPHAFFGIDADGHTTVVRTTGNPHVHVVLRGGTSGPNFDRSIVQDAFTRTAPFTKHNRPIMVDCSHANSNKDHRRQRLVLDDVLAQWQQPNHGVLGVMIESNIHEGRQDWKPDLPLDYGVSITDACVGWDETVDMLHAARDVVKQSR
jgi:3-deoxy-7-phosphoheptulonate synthase